MITISNVRLLIAVASIGTACSALAQATSPGPMEEVIVTGTHVGNRSDNPSPVNILTSNDLRELAMPALGEVIAHQTFNYGSSWLSNEYAITYQDSNRTSANLRGLGTNATLVLLNGRRTVDDNVNNLYPQVAIDRIETVLNGASAVYGSGAVAGVVNIIPRTTYEGLQLNALVNGDDEGDYTQTDVSALFGRQTTRGHLVLAGEYRYNDRLRQRDRAEYLRGGYSYSGSSPVPNVHELRRNPSDGALFGDFGGTNPFAFHDSLDPGCGVWDGPGGKDLAARNNHMSGRINPLSSPPWAALSSSYRGDCQFAFGEFFEFVAKNKSLNLWGYADHEFNEHVTLEIEALYGRQRAENRGSPSNPSNSAPLLPLVAGEHPGNPFRAMLDTNGDGILDSPIQAVDGSAFLAPNGVADRDCDGNGTVDTAAEAQLGEGNTDCVVIVGGSTSDEDGDGVSDLFDPDFGVGFNEDVALRDYRPFGKLGTLPSVLDADGSNIGAGKFHSDDIRASSKLNFFLPHTSWGGSLSLLHQRYEFEHYIKGESLSALRNALLGQGGPAQNEYFNPFSTTTLICEDRVCRLPAADGSEDQLLVSNTQSLVDSIAIRDQDNWTRHFTSVNLTFSGAPVELPAGTLGVALGAEWRRQALEQDFNGSANACDLFVEGCRFDTKVEQGITAGFFEAYVPVLDVESAGSVELQIAGRYETAGHGLDSFDPRFSALWRPREWVSVRGAWGTAFIFPTPEQLGTGATSSNLVGFVYDSITGDVSGVCGFTGCTKRAIWSGNKDLSPEDATTWNVGLSFALLDGDLMLSLDHERFEIKNRIVQPYPDQIVQADADAYFAAGNISGDLAAVAAWMCENGGPGDCRIHRGPDTKIQYIAVAPINSDEKVQNVSSDASIAYRFSGSQLPWIGGDYGAFSIELQGTWVHKYELDLGESTGDAAGQQNDQSSSIPPIPRLQAIATFSWLRGPFSAFWRSRFTDSVRGDSVFNTTCAARDGAIGDIWAEHDVDCATQFNSVVYHDVAVSFTTGKLLGAGHTLQLTVGADNVLDEDVPPLFFLGGIETMLYDPRGRMIYGRISANL